MGDASVNPMDDSCKYKLFTLDIFTLKFPPYSVNLFFLSLYYTRVRQIKYNNFQAFKGIINK